MTAAVPVVYAVASGAEAWPDSRGLLLQLLAVVREVTGW